MTEVRVTARDKYRVIDEAGVSAKTQLRAQRGLMISIIGPFNFDATYSGLVGLL